MEHSSKKILEILQERSRNEGVEAAQMRFV
jgi:hypothetical protein